MIIEVVICVLVGCVAGSIIGLRHQIRATGWRIVRIWRSGQQTRVVFKKLSKTARVPVRATQHAAGYDLYSDETVTIGPNTQCLISTGLSLQIENPNCYGRIASRSGLASRHYLHVQAGVCDRDYSGCIMVLLSNAGHQTQTIFKGERCAQIIFERRFDAIFVECDDDDNDNDDDELNESSAINGRGDRGFGSTGSTNILRRRPVSPRKLPAEGDESETILASVALRLSTIGEPEELIDYVDD